jgi:integrase/recombinase XerC
MTALVRHAAERHAPPDGRLLRYADGRAGHLPAPRRPAGPHRPAPAVGPHPADQHPLAAAHHLDLGGAQLRLRGCPRLRRAHRRHGRHRQRHVDVRAALAEVTAALAALTGEPHPLAEPEAGEQGSAGPARPAPTAARGRRSQG